MRQSGKYALGDSVSDISISQNDMKSVSIVKISLNDAVEKIRKWLPLDG